MDTPSPSPRFHRVTFLSRYLVEDQGYSSVGLGFQWMLLYVMGTISQPVMGIVSDKCSRKTVLLPAFAIMGTLYLILPSAVKGIQLALVIAAMGACFYGAGNVATAAVLDVVPRQIQGTTNSIMSLFQQVITLPSPIIAGNIAKEFGLSAVFYFCASLLSLATLAWVFIRITPRAKGA
jgi:sugar phosphate permease